MAHLANMLVLSSACLIPSLKKKKTFLEFKMRCCHLNTEQLFHALSLLQSPICKICKFYLAWIFSTTVGRCDLFNQDIDFFFFFFLSRQLCKEDCWLQVELTNITSLHSIQTVGSTYVLLKSTKIVSLPIRTDN